MPRHDRNGRAALAPPSRSFRHRLRHRTGTSFTKPIDPLLGKAIETWQHARPQQPKMLDRKTGEQVDFLFAHQAKRLANTYLNTAVLPLLCGKVGVPTADVRGNITSHRARSTIASRLYNAKELMTLSELQAGWPAPAATSAPPRSRREPNSSKPRPTRSACS